MPTLPAYAELHCVSNFSFLRGASHPEELIERACELGYRALALTDKCSVAGAVRAHIEACNRDFKLIMRIGISNHPFPHARLYRRRGRASNHTGVW